MAARIPLIAGNWKMNGDIPRTRQLCAALTEKSGRWPSADVAVFPPYVSLAVAAEALRGSRIALGAQNMHEANAGAFTGEVSASMLLTAGCRMVILGHSERRRLFGETDAGINRKTHAALAAQLKPIVCVGETLEERESGRTFDVIESQAAGSLDKLNAEQMLQVTVAYEPVWAIGTGKVATVAQAVEAHRFIRGWLATTHSREVSERVRILYGGSVKADNAGSLLAEDEIDGVLVGGASLVADEFDAIVRAAGQRSQRQSGL